MRAFVANPIGAIPQAVYEEDFVAMRASEGKRAWITAPALIKAVLLDERDKFAKLTQIRLLRPMLGKGLLTSEGPEWKWQRQAAAPMFRPQELASFVPTFVRAAEDAVARWRTEPAGSVHGIDKEMTRATFEVIAATVLPAADDAFAQQMEHSISKLQRNGGWDMLYAALGIPSWMPRPGIVAARNAVAGLRTATTELVRGHRERGERHDNLMGRLIAARDPESGRTMGDEQLVDNLLTFYLAGHDTTAKALTWTLYLLARSPQWSAMLEDEIERVTGGAAVESAHIERLVLTQQVIKESMRLYPPAPMMSRQAIADATIGGHAIAKGTSLLIPIYAIHRHRLRWERPDEFDPMRFSPENEGAIERYQYMPFGAGPRICIGLSFAMIEATAILATLVRHARFEAVESHDPLPMARVTLMPRGGMPLRVTMR
jgi:cytochrome P450